MTYCSIICVLCYNKDSIGDIIADYEKDAPPYIDNNEEGVLLTWGNLARSYRLYPFYSELVLALPEDSGFDNPVYTVSGIKDDREGFSDYHIARLERIGWKVLSYVPGKKVKSRINRRLEKINQVIAAIVNAPYSLIWTSYIPVDGSGFDDFKVRSGTKRSLWFWKDTSPGSPEKAEE